MRKFQEQILDDGSILNIQSLFKEFSTTQTTVPFSPRAGDTMHGNDSKFVAPPDCILGSLI